MEPNSSFEIRDGWLTLVVAFCKGFSKPALHSTTRCRPDTWPELAAGGESADQLISAEFSPDALHSRVMASGTVRLSADKEPRLTLSGLAKSVR